MSPFANALWKKVYDDGRCLTAAEEKIIRGQIRKNSLVIDDYVGRIDLIVNQEGHPRNENFVMKLRERLYLLIAENDTFRRVYWHHVHLEELKNPRPASPFLVA